jgi:hypothetical protein
MFECDKCYYSGYEPCPRHYPKIEKCCENCLYFVLNAGSKISGVCCWEIEGMPECFKIYRPTTFIDQGGDCNAWKQK